MQKLRAGRKFARKKDQRKALMKALFTALISHEKIRTTEAKAKETKRYFEKLITYAKRDTIASKRLLAGIIAPDPLKKLMQEIAPRYKNRQGGYTRVIKLGPRRSDASKMAIIELVK